MRFAIFTAVLALGLTGCNLNGVTIDVSGLPSLDINGKCSGNQPQDGGGKCDLVWNNPNDGQDDIDIDPADKEDPKSDPADNTGPKPIGHMIGTDGVISEMFEPVHGGGGFANDDLGHRLRFLHPFSYETGETLTTYDEWFVQAYGSPLTALPSGTVKYGEYGGGNTFVSVLTIYNSDSGYFQGSIYLEANFDQLKVTNLTGYQWDGCHGGCPTYVPTRDLYVQKESTDQININASRGTFSGNATTTSLIVEDPNSRQLEVRGVFSTEETIFGVMGNESTKAGFMAGGCNNQCTVPPLTDAHLTD